MFLVLFTDRMDHELSYLVRGIIAQMKQKVNLPVGVLTLVTLCSAGNLLLLWCGVPWRLYFSAAVPYYAGLIAPMLLPDGAFLALVGAFSFLCCCIYGACLVSTRPAAFALGFYGVDTVALLLLAVCLVENPLCCLPELLAHGLVLTTLCAGA